LTWQDVWLLDVFTGARAVVECRCADLRMCGSLKW